MALRDSFTELVKELISIEERPEEVIAERFGETITPNMRALRLSMTVADFLLSMSIPASDVVGISLDITGRYCERKVAVDISSTILMFSQDRGNNREPLTLIRTSAVRSVNSTTIQALQELAEDIHKGKLELIDAEEQLQAIIDTPRQYPHWVLAIGNGSISAGIGALLSGSLAIIAITFVVGALISHMVRVFAEKQMPAFFIQVLAAAITTVIAAAITWLGNNGLDSLQSLDPNLIIIGGIVMLVSGLAIVGAVEDAIDEYYVTANARILRVFMMTSGIIAGIVFGLFIAGKIGVNLVVNTNQPVLSLLSWQYIGVFMIAGGYALSTHSRLKGVILSGLTGSLGWMIYVFGQEYFIQVVAVFIAAVVVGSGATLLSRWLRLPSTMLITAGVIPLVPGLALSNGLMAVILRNSENAAVLGSGSELLLDALLIALAIAAGASVGRLVTRPLRRTLVRAQNSLPIRKIRN